MTKDLIKPYFMVTFISKLKADSNEYKKMSEKMISLVENQEGFLGSESVRSPDGLGITISFWKDLESIKKWKKNSEHLEAQRLGKEKWYSDYKVIISEVL